VGSLDQLDAHGRLSNSGLQAELDFVNASEGTSFTGLDKICSDSGSCEAIITDLGNGEFAIDLPDDPLYFLIKTGAGSDLSQTGDYACDGSNNKGGDDCDHFLFSNLDSTEFGVFTFEQLGLDDDIGKISHIDVFDTSITTIPVPEPGGLLLFGAGLAGVTWLGMRKKRKAKGQ
ncbi:MAG TPA: PEP-CTERM sorting domain-containing protein, partial [Gammaproteobacteria bacterium]|nr:PEP-CTERM sorting domain-containing protein [Gammaproteobacteria bacterium]